MRSIDGRCYGCAHQSPDDIPAGVWCGECKPCPPEVRAATLGHIPVPKDGFPIPVERLGSTNAGMLACGKCGTSRQADLDEIGLSEGLGSCPRDCGGWLEWAYQEGDKCPGCGKLGWWDGRQTNGACSRLCQLQAEYAESLKARA